MKLSIPETCLVVLAGPSGAGKSTFARRHFQPTEVLSSDACRGLVCDDENDQTATGDAFEVLLAIAAKRLARGKLTVVDATSVRPEDRRQYVALARSQHVLPVVIVLDMPPAVCLERNQGRPDRAFAQHVVQQQSQSLRRHLRGLKREGFRSITVLGSPEDAAAVQIDRHRLYCNRKDAHGPFDLIGDVHGCYDELVTLLGRLGYDVGGTSERPEVMPPQGRRAIFLGDLVDRGPNSPAVLRLVMAMCREGAAFCVPGNHDIKLKRKLQGQEVTVAHGLAETLAQLEGESEAFKAEVSAFVQDLVSHLVLDDGKLVVAHAGLREDMQGRASGKVRDFALYGETTGETDAFGLPVRYNWAADYRGAAMVVYGHTPVPEPVWLNRTLCIDTGCVFGGQLTALRYPEKELVQVPAARVYYEPVRPLQSAEPERPYQDLLDLRDVSGKRIVSTRVHRTVTLHAENTAAALEVMSRFAADPHWLIYLPPTMAPSETRSEGHWLEHPQEAFAYYRKSGITQVICQEKHMGSRAVMVVCRDAATAQRRFGVSDGSTGLVYTRTGRRFFAEEQHHVAVQQRIVKAMQRSGLWERLQTDWVCLDAEIMPWSAKAGELLRSQYAPVGSAATHGLDAAIAALQQAHQRQGGDPALLERCRARRECADHYVEAYRRYCWEVASVADLKIAPFHLLASEGCAHFDKSHAWHMETLGALCQADPGLLHATPYRLIDLADAEQEAQGVAWWEALTEGGGEGMVVKPLTWVHTTAKGLVQPALKCRGREYLRLIYGPEYTLPSQMDRLRARNVGAKRSLAAREFALSLEGLQRFVEGEPLYRVHECVFGVLALESQPVDPRL